MLSNEQTVFFLRKNPALSVSILEKEAGLPTSTLAKALNGDRVLNTKHLAALYPILIKYGYNEVSIIKLKLFLSLITKGRW
jgi:chromosome partitioning protein